MAQIPTPPASRQPSESPEVQLKGEGSAGGDVDVDVDSLLERYLGLLDRHQKLQAELAKQLSAGFMSLAHANYTCPPGRRYGADYYDERMKATRRVLLHSSQTENEESNDAPPENPCVFTIEARSGQEEEEEQTPQPETEPVPEQGTDEHPPAGDSTPTNKSHAEDDTDNTTPAQQDDPKPSQPRKKFRSSDPLTWYGILVPPSLRSSQKSFTEAVEQQIPALATVVADMQTVEKEIARARSNQRS